MSSTDANGAATNNGLLRMKIISLGNAEVGKSCIIKRYCEKRFVAKYLVTIGIDYGVTRVNIKSRDVKINIFDMAGHPLFYEVRNEFYQDTQGALLVFDVTNRASYECLDRWLHEMRTEMRRPGEVDQVIFVVCGNKIDKKPRQVEEWEARQWCDQRGFHYFETSAQSGDGINAMFQFLFESMLTTFTSGKGGQARGPTTTQVGYNKEQAEAIHRLMNAKDNHERLGLLPGASKDDINKAYKRLAILLHPDKNVAPGSEEAFKLLVAARSHLLNVQTNAKLS